MDEHTKGESAKGRRRTSVLAHGQFPAPVGRDDALGDGVLGHALVLAVDGEGVGALDLADEKDPQIVRDARDDLVADRLKERCTTARECIAHSLPMARTGLAFAVASDESIADSSLSDAVSE